MKSWIQLYRFGNPVLPVQVSDSVLTGIGPLKNMSISFGISFFSGIGASLIMILPKNNNQGVLLELLLTAKSAIIRPDTR